MAALSPDVTAALSTLRSKWGSAAPGRLRDGRVGEVVGGLATIPADAEEGLAIAGSLLAGRTVDLLVIDLPPRLHGAARVADRLGRLAALSRRAGISLVVLEPPGLVAGIANAVGEATGIRLELAR